MKNVVRWRAPGALAVGALALLTILWMAGGPMLATTAAAAPSDPTRCQFDAIGVTSAGLGKTPGVWDTAPSGPAGRAVYFARPGQGSGQINLTITLSNYPADHTCYLYHSAAFGVAAHTAPVTDTLPTVLTLPIDAATISQTLTLIAADTPGGTVQIAPQQLVFIADDAPPTVSAAAIQTHGNAQLYATGTRLFYGALTADTAIMITGSATDNATGGGSASTLAQVSFSAAFGSTPPPVNAPLPNASLPNVLLPDSPLAWTATYTLPTGLNESGLITATAADRVGNHTRQPFTYEPDLTPPTSLVTATVGATAGPQPIPIRFSAADTGAGMQEVALYYKTNRPGSQWAAWPEVLHTAQSGEFSFIPPITPLIGTLTYYFTSRALDRVNNRETQRAVPDTAVIIRPVHVFVPVVARNQIGFANGSFEQGWINWSATTGALGASLAGGQTHGVGAWSARLGSPAYAGNGDVPVGNSSIWQTFTVAATAAPRLTVWYHIQTYDMVFGYVTPRYYDSFEIYINRSPTTGDAPDANDPYRKRLCRDQIGQPDTLQAGLVFCDGGPTRAGNALADLGWRSVTLDLSAFRGQNITLYLANYNRVDGYYNTWTYVDDMSINW